MFIDEIFHITLKEYMIVYVSKNNLCFNNRFFLLKYQAWLDPYVI